MTKSTITREQVIALIAEHSYDSALVDALEHLLATMNSEPVAFTEKHEISNMHATGIYLRAWPADRARNAVEGYTIPLYLHAQPAPVVPQDVLEALQKVARIRLDMNDFDGDRRGIADCLGDAEEALIEVVNRRAAMLAAAPQSPGSEPATVPGKWIPVSEQMPPSRHEVLVGRWWGEKPRWCCKWATYIPGHPDAQSSGWLIPGASWTPTHWMPLPAAPQEVKDGK
ncbi:TPA: DUF551 domain-containing protein [Klebsiella pneumoniae]|nr:DUF551 domain-containing protein [Klebsiella pneumoniae]